MDTPLTKLLNEKLQEVFGGNASELARVVDTSQQNVSNYLSGGVRRPHYWRQVADALGISHDEIMRLTYPNRPNRMVMSAIKRPDAIIQAPEPKSLKTTGKMLPVLGEAVGGVEGMYIFNGSILDYVACPPSLENVNGAYAVFIDGESMSPRYKPGETVWVHPTKPARRGDDVIVQIHPPEDDGSPPWGYVKEFIGWTSNKLMLHQHNPAIDIEFERDEVVSVHPIVLSGKY